ncbi:hypothetical protein [Simkania sp.]|uniref:hypothetical protein n=1 Tax=Simkania sp. TaxID=34094 RepID=UPI003B5253D6
MHYLGSVYDRVVDSAALDKGPSEFPSRTEEEVGRLVAKYSQRGRNFFEKIVMDFPSGFQLNVDGRVTALTMENYQTVEI